MHSRPIFKRAQQPTLLAITILFAALGPSAVFGNDSDTQADNAVTPPSVTESVDIQYPAEYAARNISHTVVAEVSVDITGTVTNVVVKESMYPLMAQALKEALFRFKFSPALKGGHPIASTVRYRHIFAPPAQGDASTEPIDSTDTPSDLPPRSSQVTLSAPKDTTEFETIVKAPPPTIEVVKYGVSHTEFARVPGASSDQVKAVRALPGVGQSFDGDAGIIVRGSPPADTGFYMDGLAIPVTFHMDMSDTSVLNASLLEDITFYPGNFSVRYGDAMGAIIDISPKTLNADCHRKKLESNLKYSGFSVEGPINSKWQWAAAARHSYSFFDTRFRDRFHSDYPVEEDYRFYDYQGILQKKSDHKRQFSLFLFGADDDATETIAYPEFDYEQRTRKKVGFHKVQLKWQRRLRHHRTNLFQIALGYQRTEPELYSYRRFVLKAVPVSIREELTIRPGDGVNVRMGLDSWMGYAWWEVTNFGGRKFDGATPFVFPGLYSEMTLFPIDRLTAVMGLRVNLAPRIMEVAVVPRFSTRYQFTKRTVFKAGFGFFHQPPSHEAQDEDYGNPNLNLQRAVHYNAGVEQQLTEYIYLDVEGFYRNLSDLVIRRDEVNEDGYASINFSNDGRGHVYGLETMLRHSPSDRFMGWLSYTLMKSTRQTVGEKKVPSAHDQRHVLTIWGSVTLGRGWDVGAKFRLASGNPYTPITGYDPLQTENADGAEVTVYQPIPGEPYSARMPLFHQLDIKIEKRFAFNKIDFSAYLEVLNVYNQRTPKYYYNLPQTTTRYAHAPNHFYPNLGVTAAF